MLQMSKEGCYFVFCRLPDTFCTIASNDSLGFELTTNNCQSELLSDRETRTMQKATKATIEHSLHAENVARLPYPYRSGTVCANFVTVQRS